MFTLNPLAANRVAISLIENDIKPTRHQFNQHGIGDTCWCGPKLFGISGNQYVFNHVGGGEHAKIHNYPRYFASAVGET